MKKTFCLVTMILLISALFGQYPLQFFIETDAEIYEYGQPIQITYHLYNPSSEPVEIMLNCYLPFSYGIDEVVFPGDCLPVCFPILIQPYSSFTANETHTDTLSDGNHIIYGIWAHGGNNFYTPDVFINVVQTNTVVVELSTNTFNLSNFPNPFNPSTTIQFELAEAGKVCLEIFNIKGQKVKTLVHEFLPIGKHEFVWKGKDEKNQSVASGIYFYKIHSSKYTTYRKMILMK